MFCYITKMLLGSFGTRFSKYFESGNTVFLVFGVNLYTLSDSSSTILSQITKKLLNICSLTFSMLITTTARQTSNCMQIITYHVASFRTNHFQNTMSRSLVFSWFRVNTDRKNRLILCYIPDNCAIALWCFVSINYSIIFINDHFSPFENSTKFKIKMSQVIVQIYNFHLLHQKQLNGVTSSCCSWRDALW